MIVGVLFLHEMGHLAAMRLFDYRNLRMFFIPFFGAAVTGQNYNVPGWKKAVVSLMGPLPGIVLGALLGVAAAIGEWPLMMQAAILLVVINAFNLLPLMPLDGGRVMHAVLFSRHPIFDVVFRAIAAVILILSALVGGRFLAVIGVFMLIGLPTVYRVGKVVQRLRERGFDANSPDSQTIPPETARAIYDGLCEAMPSQMSTKTSAQLTLQSFELLNAKPPGVAASLALVGVLGSSILASLVLFVVLMAARDAVFNRPALPPHANLRVLDRKSEMKIHACTNRFGQACQDEQNADATS
ncbi:MAG TPA: site-2 protease family protein [Thermoguttaceae bacterium]|nr:site-2 protease family protein [Thermoguttaceae bacterium]